MEGWRCPGCGRCYSPTMSQCGYCGPGAMRHGKVEVDLTTTRTDVQSCLIDLRGTDRNGLVRCCPVRDEHDLPTEGENATQRPVVTSERHHAPE